MNVSMDRLGMVVSIGCAIHCILMPIILPILPMIGFLFGHDSYFHILLSFVIVAIALVALVPGYLKHKMLKPIVSACIGITIIVTTGILEHFIKSPLIVIVTIIGSTFIVTGHYLNHKYTCKCTHHHHTRI